MKAWGSSFLPRTDWIARARARGEGNFPPILFPLRPTLESRAWPSARGAFKKGAEPEWKDKAPGRARSPSLPRPPPPARRTDSSARMSVSPSGDRWRSVCIHSNPPQASPLSLPNLSITRWTPFSTGGRRQNRGARQRRCLYNVTFHLFSLPRSARGNLTTRPGGRGGRKKGGIRARSGGCFQPIGEELRSSLRLSELPPPAPQGKQVSVRAARAGGEEGNLPPFFNNFLPVPLQPESRRPNAGAKGFRGEAVERAP